MSSETYILLGVMAIVGVLIWLKVHAQSKALQGMAPVITPASVAAAPATVAQAQAIQADVRNLTDRIQTAAAISNVSKRLEDLHSKFDRGGDGGESKQGEGKKE